LLAGLIGSLAVVAATLAAHGTGADGAALAARYTARFSFGLFLIAFLAAPLARRFPSDTTRMLVRERRGIGLAFAAAHFVHLAALIAAYVLMSDASPSLRTLVFGGFGYVVIAVMAATSNDAAQRALGARTWRGLHTFGIYYVWFIFAFTYAGRIAARPDMVEYWVLMTLGVLALAFRILARRKRAGTAQPAE
jgi:DMSO/TMAO reductase YedYZ heme-binding membrane subunit